MPGGLARYESILRPVAGNGFWENHEGGDPCAAFCADYAVIVCRVTHAPFTGCRGGATLSSKGLKETGAEPRQGQPAVHDVQILETKRILGMWYLGARSNVTPIRATFGHPRCQSWLGFRTPERTGVFAAGHCDQKKRLSRPRFKHLVRRPRRFKHDPRNWCLWPSHLVKARNPAAKWSRRCAPASSDRYMPKWDFELSTPKA